MAYKKEFHFEDEYYRWMYLDFLYEDIKLIFPDMSYDEEEVKSSDHSYQLEDNIWMKNISN
jgi:hypothetical protein